MGAAVRLVPIGGLSPTGCKDREVFAGPVTGVWRMRQISVF
jgi:hypothetical protein